MQPIIEKWIEMGTVIISDCWKAYCNVEKWVQTFHGKSQEFINAAGQSIKMEGHWQKVKAKLPPLGLENINCFLPIFTRVYVKVYE